MFYFLSKIIALFLNPIVWVVILFVLSFFLKNKKYKKRSIFLGIFILLFFSNSVLFNEVLRSWEIGATKRNKITKHYDYGIVLTGTIRYNQDIGRFNFLRSSDRIWQAAKLYHNGSIDKLLITGGAASFFSKDTIESALLKEFLIDTGIPECDIITEEKSRNTRENALYTAQLLEKQEYDNLLLITSAMHMRRSNLCFVKVGLECDLYPTDHYVGTRKYNFDQIFIPSAQTLSSWQALFHELFGIVSYKIAGYL